MRWILTAIAALGFLIALLAHSPGLMTFGVLTGLICGIGAAFAFIDVRIRDSSRSEYMTPGELEAFKSTLKPPAQSGTPNLPPPS